MANTRNDFVLKTAKGFFWMMRSGSKLVKHMMKTIIIGLLHHSLWMKLRGWILEKRNENNTALVLCCGGIMLVRNWYQKWSIHQVTVENEHCFGNYVCLGNCLSAGQMFNLSLALVVKEHISV